MWYRGLNLWAHAGTLIIGFVRSLPKIFCMLEEAMQSGYILGDCTTCPSLYSSTCSKHLWVSLSTTIAIRAHEYYQTGNSMVSAYPCHQTPRRFWLGWAWASHTLAVYMCTLPPVCMVCMSCPPGLGGGVGGGGGGGWCRCSKWYLWQLHGYLSTHCDFVAYPNEALCDRLVCSLRNESTQKHLLATNDNLAQSMESTAHHSTARNWNSTVNQLTTPHIHNITPSAHTARRPCYQMTFEDAMDLAQSMEVGRQGTLKKLKQ